MILIMLVVAALVVYTGPACEDLRARRRMRREFPAARMLASSRRY